MLADAPWPHGSGANLAVVGTLSEGFGRIVASPPYLVGYVRWDARSDRFTSLCQTIFFNSFTDRTLTMSLDTSSCVQKLQAASHGTSWVFFREPDAGNLPVRFDEREQETEPSQTGLR